MSVELASWGVELFGRWTAMWNRELAASEIMAPEFRLRYAQPGAEVFDSVRDPAALDGIVAAWHGMRSGLRFQVEGAASVDLVLVDGLASGRVARPYGASYLDAAGQRTVRSGIDLLQVSGGLVTEVWSASGGAEGRAFYP